MEASYGAVWLLSPRVVIDRRKVPNELHPIVPYAEFWGVSDDSIRQRLLESAPDDVLKNLKQTVRAYNKKLNAWLSSQEQSGRSPNPRPTLEYVTFVALIMAADYV
jgi:hypothetical protein